MKIYFKYLVFLSYVCSVAQSFQLEQPTRFMQLNNPSYLGINAKNTLGFVYQSGSIAQNEILNQQYAFGSFKIPEQQINLAVDFNSFINNQIGIKENQLLLNFVYHLQINDELFLLPSISTAYVSAKVGLNDILLEDQLNQQTGSFSNVSIDPFLTNNILADNYLDVGVGVLLHHPYFLVGFSASRVNLPQSSFNNQIQ